jgi:glyoxylase-like metal-dependent hydrolase (beta-lactamase superfamily II)
VPTDNIGTPPLAIRSFTSSEAGAWSNSYLVSGTTEALLFDVFMLHSEAVQLAEDIAESGKALKTVMVSHAHPDHFMGLDAIRERFPHVRIVSTANVVADIQADGPWMVSMLQSKLGSDGPTRLIVPEAIEDPRLRMEGHTLEVVEFGEGESKHIAAVYIENSKTLLSADLVYHDAHLYLQEHHLESWLTRLDELEAFATGRVVTIHPGHGAPAGLELIAQTRQYLQDFAKVVKSGDGQAAQAQMLTKYPNHHVRQFLTVFSIPAYFPSAHPTPAPK